MPKILVLHGPNPNLPGQRETQHYGHDSLQSTDPRLVEQITDRVHVAKSDETALIVIHPAACAK